VIIEAEKPGVAIGKDGEILQEIKKKTLWVPIIRRTPTIRSQLIENIREVLYQNNDYRRKFLHKTGERIYNGWLRRQKKEEWVRLTYLGSGREVGRSSILLQTPESRVLLDCGINAGADSPEDMYPYLEAPEFNISQLDAVIVSHAHLDHSALIPYLFKFGYR
jgi:predicted metal-dependent RNase